MTCLIKDNNELATREDFHGQILNRPDWIRSPANGVLGACLCCFVNGDKDR